MPEAASDDMSQFDPSQLTSQQLQALLPDLESAAISLLNVLDGKSPDDSTNDARVYYCRCGLSMYLEAFRAHQPLDSHKLMDAAATLEAMDVQPGHANYVWGLDMIAKVNLALLYYEIFNARAAGAHSELLRQALERLDGAFPDRLLPQARLVTTDEDALATVMDYAYKIRTWLLIHDLRRAAAGGGGYKKIVRRIFMETDRPVLRGAGNLVDLAAHDDMNDMCHKHLQRITEMAEQMETPDLADLADMVEEEARVGDDETVALFFKQLLQLGGVGEDEWGAEGSQRADRLPGEREEEEAVRDVENGGEADADEYEDDGGDADEDDNDKVDEDEDEDEDATGEARVFSLPDGDPDAQAGDTDASVTLGVDVNVPVSPFKVGHDGYARLPGDKRT
jgi:hypothetical protein